MQFWDKGIQLVTGCTKVSAGCLNCWSEKSHSMRAERTNPGIYAPEQLCSNKFNGLIGVHMRLLEAAAKRRKPTVYAIWNDLYHEGMPTEQIIMAWEIMSAAKHHTWLIITKRPERAQGFVAGVMEYSGATLPNHIWHIATTENQEMLEKRLPYLLNIPGNRGLIIEPCLGPIHFPTLYKGDIHQVLLGPENGQGKRPFYEEWGSMVKYQCDNIGIPFYRKDTEQGELVWRHNA